MDPVTVLIAAVVFTAGWLFGRHARRKAIPRQPQPICLCGDHYGTHNPKTGACQTLNKVTMNGAQHHVRCPCVRYTGPQPVEQYWVPPVADMNIVTAPRPIERSE